MPQLSRITQSKRLVVTTALVVSLLVVLKCSAEPRSTSHSGESADKVVKAEIVKLNGSTYLRIGCGSDRQNDVAIPVEGIAYVLKDGAKWSLDGVKLDEDVRHLKKLYSCTEVVRLRQNASILLTAPAATDGSEVMIDIPRAYD